MKPAFWEVVQEIFHEAVLLPTRAEREAFLAERCGSDERLLEEVSGLLADTVSADQDTTFLEPPTMARAPAGAEAPVGTLTGTMLGSCRVGELLGEGGMGAVYAGVQTPWNRQVAIKVMHRLGHAARQRFDFEARVLANLRHPGIAQIYETGTREDAGGAVTPYFVMEFVEGARVITDWCEAEQVDLRGRCELVARLCDAVHHGHLKGVIHRDLKPGNLLVDRDGHPKVIDFGVARATDADSWERSFETVEGMIVGTPAYMSPEQLRGDHEDLDARTDAYSLGVVLYELLTGERPHTFSGKPFDLLVREVREEPPPRPSRTVPALRGDLDTIVTTALAKDPARRYESVAALGQDLRHWLDGLPIQARPLTIGYQIRLFARRNRVLVGAAVLVLVLLVGAAGLASVLAIRATRAEKSERLRADQAERLAENSRAFSEWVAREFQLAIGELPGSTPLRRQLLARVTSWLDDVRSVAGSTPRLMRTVARSYLVAAEIEGSGEGLSEPERALATTQKALDILVPMHDADPSDPELALDLALAWIHRATYLQQTANHGEVATVAAAASRALDRVPDEPVYRDRLAELRGRSLFVQAMVARDLGRWSKAIEGMASGIESLGRPADDADLESCFTFLDWNFLRLQAVWQNGDEAAARKIWEDIQPIVERVAPEDARTVSARLLRARALSTRADFENFADGDREAALKSYAAAEKLLADLLEADPAHSSLAEKLAVALSRQGKLLVALGRHKEAAPLAERELKIQRQLSTAAPDSERAQLNLRMSLSHMAMVRLLSHDTAGAVSHAAEALALAKRLVATTPDGTDHQIALAEATASMGNCVFPRSESEAGIDPAARIREARAHWARAIEIFEKVLADAPGTWGVAAQLAGTKKLVASCDELLKQFDK